MLDRAFHWIMTRVVETGQAPHYVDVAKALGVPIETARQTLHDIMAAGYPGWLHPQTDLIASWPPFNILPTQYRVTVDGTQKWTAQCGLESLAVRWMFPGKTVRIDAPCLDCGESMSIEMRDEEPLLIEPEAMVAYAWGRIGGSLEERPWRCAGMHLFRSEAHARRWPHYNEQTEQNLRPVAFWADVFSGGMFRNRSQPAFLSWLRSEEGKTSVAETVGKLPITNWTAPST